MNNLTNRMCSFSEETNSESVGKEHSIFRMQFHWLLTIFPKTCYPWCLNCMALNQYILFVVCVVIIVVFRTPYLDKGVSTAPQEENVLSLPTAGL